MALAEFEDHDSWVDPDLELVIAGRPQSIPATRHPRVETDPERLAQLIRPTAMAAQRTLPVDPGLAPLLPTGALQRGTTVRLAGPGATSLTLALVARASAEGSWVGFVGADDLGWSAVADHGVDLSRVLVVDSVPAGQWATVTGALVDAVELVVMAPSHLVRHVDARRLAARARERGAVLIVTRSCPWPIEADITMHATDPQWHGLGNGHGRLTARSLTISTEGRRAAATERRLNVWLPNPSGTLETSTPEGGTDPVNADLVNADQFRHLRAVSREVNIA